MEEGSYWETSGSLTIEIPKFVAPRRPISSRFILYYPLIYAKVFPSTSHVHFLLNGLFRRICYSLRSFLSDADVSCHEHVIHVDSHIRH